MDILLLVVKQLDFLEGNLAVLGINRVEAVEPVLEKCYDLVVELYDVDDACELTEICEVVDFFPSQEVPFRICQLIMVEDAIDNIGAFFYVLNLTDL